MNLIFILILIFNFTILSAGNKFVTDKGFVIGIDGYYSIYYEYFYDIRDDIFHISTFPEYIKVERGDKYSDPEIGITNALYCSRYMAIEPLRDREPNHYIELNINSSLHNNYYTFFKFYLNSSDDLDRFYNNVILRLKQGHFKIEKEDLNLNLFFREKIEGFDDPLEIFKPGRAETFLRNNPDPIRVFEWNGDECQGMDFKYRKDFLEFRGIVIDGLAKWYYSGWPNFNSYFNDIWVLGARAKFKISDNFKCGTSFLLNSWYSSSASEYEDHWYIYSFDIEYLVNQSIIFKSEYASSGANYDAYESLPHSKGEAYKIEIIGKDLISGSRVSLSYRNIEERFPTGLTLYVPNNTGYNLKTELLNFKRAYLMFFYDYQYKHNNPDENKQEMGSEIRFEFIKELVLTKFLFQSIILNNERFIWWLQHTYEKYNEYRPGVEIRPKNNLKFEVWYDYIFYEQPHKENYKPDIEQSLWTEIEYNVFKNLILKFGYKYIKNKIVWNLDEHLYRLKEYEKLRELRPKPDDIYNKDYGDSYGYYISDDDNIYYEGDTLSHHILWFNLKWQIFKKSALNISWNLANYNGNYGYWDKKISLSLETYF